ncbi:TraR/DksA C4-type zinc finger protein [Kribbella sp. NPDC026596]|uniref:TraR/DksA C4-type zinc finger protein n=1 Tax=Kribbella sp. NPDC026596 TaxID=3155122 RepID=UPI0033CA3870
MAHQVSAVDNNRLDLAELAVLRASLHEDRRFRLQQLQDIARSAADIVETTSSPDTAAHSEIRHKLAVAAQTALAETEAALARMDAGRYGGCGRCGSTIALHRLYAHPQTRYCARCQLFLEMQR